MEMPLFLSSTLIIGDFEKKARGDELHHSQSININKQITYRIRLLQYDN